MARAQWRLVRGRPMVEVALIDFTTGQVLQRQLLADTGAGAASVGFELVLAEFDCLRCGTNPGTRLTLGGAYIGAFPVYAVRLQIPALNFDRSVRAVAVPVVPKGFDGIAGLRFLNRFTYGNFGNPNQFGLEC